MWWLLILNISVTGQNYVEVKFLKPRLTLYFLSPSPNTWRIVRSRKKKEISNQPRLKSFNLNLTLTFNMAHKETCNKTKISIISSRYLVILKTHLSKQKWGSSNLNCVKICASRTYLFVCFFFHLMFSEQDSFWLCCSNYRGQLALSSQGWKTMAMR